MIPSAFDYEIATSPDHATSLLREGGEDARLIAGGHSLLPLMKLRLARPTLLVDIGRLDDLRYVREDGDRLVIGALTSHHELESSGLLAEACPLLSEAAGQIGDPQVRHRGTVGGSIAHGDPASDLPAVLLALNAELAVRGGQGERTIAIGDFFQMPFVTALESDEMLAEIRIPRVGSSGGCAYLKFSRRAQDWAIVGVAAVVQTEGDRIERAAIGLTNMGGTPLRAEAAETALTGLDVGDGKGIWAAAGRAVDETDPPQDIDASAEYRAALARILVDRAVRAALD